MANNDRTLILDQTAVVATESATRIIDATTVDLGDDLLKTKTSMASPATLDATTEVAPEKSDPIPDLIENAKILMSEGIFGEAKKNLRRVLVHDPTNSTAPKLLDQIQEIEVQRILSDEQPTSNPRRRAGDDIREPHQVLDELLAELGIDLSEASEKPFNDPAVEREFGVWLSGFGNGASAKDHLDLGVAFIQMQLYEQAVQQFRRVEMYPGISDESPLAQQARSLKAYALILGGKPFPALLELSALIEQNHIKTKDKIDWAYLSGRAHEELRNWERALYWYRAAADVEPGYRDTFERSKRCEKILSSSSS